MRKTLRAEIENLVIQSKRGDKDSIEELLNRFTPYILKKSGEVYLKGYDRDDLMQIAYIYVLNCIDKYKINSNSFTTYVIRAIDNAFNYEIRKRAKDNYEGSLEWENSDGVSLMEVLPSNLNIEEECIKKEESDLVIKLTEKLPMNYRNVIEEIFLKEISLKEYAEKYNINYSTAIKRKSRALKKLKGYMESYSVT